VSRFLVVFFLLVSPSAVLAQTHQPYAGMQERTIKALSEEQIADLRAGRGMGFALAAELNGYPGPVHVLELAEELALTEAQRVRTEELLDAVRAEAIPLGERLIADEAELDALFRTGAATPESIAAGTQAIGATEAALRAAHLKYHLLTRDVLSPDQLQRYRELRGYAESAGRAGGHGGAGHGGNSRDH
jgi:hypothetical protein